MFLTISRNTQGGTANHIFNILFRQLGSAEEPFSEYDKELRETGTLSSRKVRNGQYKHVDDFDKVVIRNNVQAF